MSGRDVGGWQIRERWGKFSVVSVVRTQLSRPEFRNGGAAVAGEVQVCGSCGGWGLYYQCGMRSDSTLLHRPKTRSGEVQCAMPHEGIRGDREDGLTID
jgi:hypothetical protein